MPAASGLHTHLQAYIQHIQRVRINSEQERRGNLYDTYSRRPRPEARHARNRESGRTDSGAVTHGSRALPASQVTPAGASPHAAFPCDRKTRVWIRWRSSTLYCSQKGKKGRRKKKEKKRKREKQAVCRPIRRWPLRQGRIRGGGADSRTEQPTSRRLRSAERTANQGAPVSPSPRRPSGEKSSSRRLPAFLLPPLLARPSSPPPPASLDGVRRPPLSSAPLSSRTVIASRTCPRRCGLETMGTCSASEMDPNLARVSTQ